MKVEAIATRGGGTAVGSKRGGFSVRCIKIDVPVLNTLLHHESISHKEVTRFSLKSLLSFLALQTLAMHEIILSTPIMEKWGEYRA